MPSKRQPSKQRRASQNRNARAQREARAQRAGALSSTVTSGPRSGGDDPPGTGSGRPGLLGGLFGGGGGGLFGGGGGLFGGRSRPGSAEPSDDEPVDDEAPDDDITEDREGEMPEADDSETDSPGPDDPDTDDETPVARPPRPEPQPVSGKGLIASRPDGTRLPGAMATFIALGLAVAATVFLTAAPTVEVDDRGEPVPVGAPTEPFKGLYLEARGFLETGETGQAVEVESKTSLEENGPAALLYVGLPMLMTAFAWWMHRRTGLSRPLTIGMLALAVGVFLLGPSGQFYIPALVALAVGSFQARKAEMPARMAERAAMQEEREARRKQRTGETDADDDDSGSAVIDVESREDDD